MENITNLNCPNCGTEVSSSLNLCSSCGFNLKSASENKDAPKVEAEIKITNTAEPVKEKNKESKSKPIPEMKKSVTIKKKSGKRNWVIGSVVVLIIALGLYKFSPGLFGGGGKVDITHIPFKETEKGRWGLVSYDGTVLVSEEWENEPSEAIEGYVRVRNKDGKTQFFTFAEKVKQAGEDYIEASFHREGLCAAVKENSPIGYYDKSMNLAFEVKVLGGKAIERAGSFFDGLARVRDEDGKWGYINTKGELAIPCTYDDAEPFSDGVAMVTKTEKKSEGGSETQFGFINKKGETVIKFETGKIYSSSSEGLIACSDDKEHKQWGFIDHEGEKIIKPSEKYLGVSPFHQGYATFYDGSLYGIMDKKGEVIIRPKYKSAFYSDGLVMINNASSSDDENKFGFINLEGDKIIEPEYESAHPFHGDYAFVKRSTKWEIIDKKGKSVGKKDFYDINYRRDQMINKYDPMVNSDFIDIGSISGKMLPDIAPNGINGLDASTDIAKLIKTFSLDKPKDGEKKKEERRDEVNDPYKFLSTSSYVYFGKELNGMISYSVKAYFSDPVKEAITATTSSVEQEYGYRSYGGYGNYPTTITREKVTGYKLSKTAKLLNIAYSYNLNRKAERKGDKIFAALKELITKKGFVLLSPEGDKLQSYYFGNKKDGAVKIYITLNGSSRIDVQFYFTDDQRLPESLSYNNMSDQYLMDSGVRFDIE